MKNRSISLVEVLPVAALVAVAAMSRLLPHIPNVTPIAAMALFAGAHLSDRRVSLLLVLGAMFLSDLFIGFDPTSPFVYFALGLTVLLGGTITGGAASVGSRSLIGSGTFFLITNFGVWMVQSLYPKTFEGLLLCYTAAIPFFRNAVVGDLIYTAALFGIFALLTNRRPSSVRVA